MPRIAVAGSINQDIVVRTPRIPVPGESVVGRELTYVRGGKGANQAVASVRFGAETLFIGRVGCDPFGDGLVAGLRECGVDASHVERDPDSPSGVAIITIDDSGENAIVVAPGANGQCSPEDIQPETMAGIAALLCQLETTDAFTEAALQAARAEGALTVLDAAPAPPSSLPPELLTLVDILTCNETEARVLLGLAPDAPADSKALAEGLLALGPEHLVLKLGEAGALASGPDGTISVAPPKIEVVDTTGAGDAFTGVLAVALAEGRSPSESLGLAVSAGSLACTVLGAQPSMPTRDAVLGLWSGA